VTLGIRWLSVQPGSGYGDASEAYLSGLRAAGIPVSWTPMGWFSGLWRQPFGPAVDLDLGGLTHADIANLPIEHDTVVVAAPPVWDDRLAREAVGRRLVAFTTWETDRMPERWRPILSHYDRVLVPSEFNRATFAASGLATPVRVVPHIARPAPHPAGSGEDGGPFVFYTIATWTSRKAVLDTVAAFVAAFDEADDVVLVVHTSAEDHIARGRSAREGRVGDAKRERTWFTLAAALAGRPGVPRIVLSTRQLDRAGIDSLHERGDCFVSLSRAEGWGLGAFDAGGRGNPVVVTGWGGSLDMLPPGYPYCVDYDLVPTTSDEPDDWWSPLPGERWAKARVAHASALLRRIFEDRAEAREWGCALRSHIHASFSPDQVTRRLLDAIYGD
jgi:glycosyltransferase involved in cell wall biosynthesis